MRAVIDRAPVVAVPEPARALYLAALARVTTRRPILVTVPTAAEAERIARDLAPIPRARRGRAVPGVGDAAVRAGVTLPRDHGPPAAGDVAAARGRRRARRRSSSRRCGPSCSGSARTSRTSSPSASSSGDAIDRDALVERLVGAWATGASTRSRRGARSRCAGSIVDVYPATADHPVRIDLWGDEVERLSRFSVGDQRSTARHRRGRGLPVPRAAPDRRGARPRRGAASPSAPWGREQWERLAEGQVFDGMESWLPWLPPRAPPARPAARRRPRAARRAAAHARPRPGPPRRGGRARRPARRHVGSRGHEFPRLSLPFDRLLARTHTATTSVLAAPDAPDTPHLGATAFDPVVGDAEALASRLRALSRAGTA